MHAYAPVIELIDTSRDNADDISWELRRKELPACLLNRQSQDSLELATELCGMFINRGILPVVRLWPDDDPILLRNLIEIALCGTVHLHWDENGEAFDTTGMFRILDGTGRHRVPLDLELHIKNVPPEAESTSETIDKIGEIADKYGHVQVVRLHEVPLNADDAAIQSVGDFFQSVVKVCPHTKPAISPQIWINNSNLRVHASDFGLCLIDRLDSGLSQYSSGELGAVDQILRQEGREKVARLPLVPAYYRKGWFSFEVGKVLDSWTDRRAFNEYKERPGWLED